MEGDKPSIKVIERVKDVYEKLSNNSVYPITRFIRKAGYYTKIHMFGYDVIGTWRGFRIIGSKDRKGLVYQGYHDSVPPEILIAIENIDFIGRHSDMTVVCPPDPNLEGLEVIVMNTLHQIFQNLGPKE